MRRHSDFKEVRWSRCVVVRWLMSSAAQEKCRRGHHSVISVTAWMLWGPTQSQQAVNIKLKNMGVWKAASWWQAHWGCFLCSLNHSNKLTLNSLHERSLGCLFIQLMYVWIWTSRVERTYFPTSSMIDPPKANCNNKQISMCAVGHRHVEVVQRNLI